MPTDTFSQLEAEEQKRILDKLAKLKALSECKTGNVNETATAAATMTRLMLEYQIDMADVEGEQGDEGIVERAALPDSYNGFPIWQKTIVSALARVNHCRCYSDHETVNLIFSRRTISKLTIFGSRSDVEHTTRLLNFCIDEVERLCYMWSPRASVKRRNDFKRGAANGIAQKVTEERERVLREELERAQNGAGASNALQLFERKQDALQKHAAKLGLRSVSKRARGVNVEAYGAGFAAGAGMDLNRAAVRALPSG